MTYYKVLMIIVIIQSCAYNVRFNFPHFMARFLLLATLIHSVESIYYQRITNIVYNPQPREYILLKKPGDIGVQVCCLLKCRREYKVDFFDGLIRAATIPDVTTEKRQQETFSNFLHILRRVLKKNYSQGDNWKFRQNKS